MKKLMSKTNPSPSLPLTGQGVTTIVTRLLNSLRVSPPLSRGGKGGVWFGILVIWLLVIAPIPIGAQSFDSTSFHIDWGNFNMTAGSKTSPSFDLTDTVGQNSPGKYDSTNYVVKSGFQYIHDMLTRPFSFSISTLAIDLGTLVPGVGSTSTNTITVTTPSGQGYQISVHETHPLRISPSLQVPDTSCDSGPCTPSSSQVWTASTAYGFGFNVLGVNGSGTVTGVGTSNYFTNSTFYRPFADASTNQVAQIIMSENAAVSQHSARVTYKALVSGLQPAGNYDTSIIFTATPKY